MIVGTRDRVIAMVVLSVGLAARIATVVATTHLKLRDDSADYHRLGLLVARGEGFGRSVLAAAGGPTALRAPLYPLFLGGIFGATGNSVIAARLVQAALGTLTVALVGVVAWQLFGRRHAVVAAALAAVYPPLILVGNGLLTESLSLPLQLGALAAALAYRHGRRTPSMAALSGVLVGASILVRPANLALVVPVGWLLGGAGAALPRRALVNLGLALAALVLTLVPWQVRNQRAFHRFVPISTADGFLVAGVYNPQAAHDPAHRAVWRSPAVIPGQAELFHDRRLDEAALSDALQHDGITYAKAHPGYIAVAAGTGFLNLFDLTGLSHARVANASLGYGSVATSIWVVSFWVVGLIAVAGAFTSAARRAPLAVWLAPVLFIVLTIPTLGTPRYRAPIEPFLVLLASTAIVAALPPASPSSGSDRAVAEHPSAAVNAV